MIQNSLLKILESCALVLWEMLSTILFKKPEKCLKTSCRPERIYLFFGETQAYSYLENGPYF